LLCTTGQSTYRCTVADRDHAHLDRGTKVTSKNEKRARLVICAVAALALMTATVGAAGARTTPHAQTPGFDGKTIKVSGLGFATNFADSSIGAEARFKTANDTDELKGVKIEYGEFADDKGDVATSIGEARRLVEQEGVFAIVPMVTASGPGDYMAQKKVPYFGWGFDKGYCGAGDTGYGFGFSGCVLPPDPKSVPAFSAGNPYKFMTEVKKIKNPTIAGIGTDSAAGATSTRSFIAQATGSGLKVVWAKNILPAAPAVVGDYSPYVQQILASNGGKGPDAMWIAAGLSDALNMPKALRAAGYKGLIMSAYYSDALIKPLSDTYVVTSFAPFEQHSAGTDKMVADIKAFKADAKPSPTMAAGYFAADFFIKAVKKAGTKNLTREALQKAAAHMTYQIKGTVGPTEYPKAFQALNSYCAAMLYDNGGTVFEVAEPFSCTNHFTKVKGSTSEVG
jgi:ABC-type branched-subunit amino acid transport system substrate-binding protein